MKFAAQAGATLWFASSDGNTDTVKRLLLDPNVDPTAEDNAAIRLACKNGHHEIVKALLEDSRANPGADSIAFKWASSRGHTHRQKV